MRVGFETAKLAHQVGFKELTDEVWLENAEYGLRNFVRNSLVDTYEVQNYRNFDAEYQCPTQSGLQAWLRDVHETHITIDYDWYLFDVRIMKWGMEEDIRLISYLNKPDSYCFYTYEEALETALQESLKLINN